MSSTKIAREAARHLVFVVLVLSVAIYSEAADDHKSLEQQALDEFAARYWRADMFSAQCSGTQFYPESTVNVFTKSPAYVITPVNVSGIAGIDLEAEAKKDNLRGLAKAGKSETGFGPLSLDGLRAMRATEWSIPKEKWDPGDGYLLRFSNRIRFRDHIYLEIWIKGSYAAGGAKVVFQFDPGGKLIRSERSLVGCDEREQTLN
jgi:hypothetical protein